jgi:hypothetical protein
VSVSRDNLTWKSVFAWPLVGTPCLAARSRESLEKELRRNTKALAQARDVFLVEIALPTQHFRNNTWCSKHIDQVLLLQSVLVHEKNDCLEWRCLRKLIMLLLKVLDQQSEHVSRQICQDKDSVLSHCAGRLTTAAPMSSHSPPLWFYLKRSDKTTGCLFASPARLCGRYKGIANATETLIAKS